MRHGLSENQFADIAQQLEVERRELLEQMRQQMRESEQSDRSDRLSQLKDPGDYSVADVMSDMALEQLDREVEKLRAISDAERRIQQGTYGECEDCGVEIQAARLLAQPTASRCIDCQEKFEREHIGRTVHTM